MAARTPGPAHAPKPAVDDEGHRDRHRGLPQHRLADPQRRAHHRADRPGDPASGSWPRRVTSSTDPTRWHGRFAGLRRCSLERSSATSPIRSSQAPSRRSRARLGRAATTSSSASPTLARPRRSSWRPSSRHASATASSCSATWAISRASSPTCAIPRPGRRDVAGDAVSTSSRASRSTTVSARGSRSSISATWAIDASPSSAVGSSATSASGRRPTPSWRRRSWATSPRDTSSTSRTRPRAARRRSVHCCASRRRPTAIVASTDVLAIGVLRGALLRGVNVPDELVGRRLRRHPDGEVDGAGSHDDPDADGGDGRRGDRPRRGPVRRRRRWDRRIDEAGSPVDARPIRVFPPSLVVRHSTAPPLRRRPPPPDDPAPEPHG